MSIIALVTEINIVFRLPIESDRLPKPKAPKKRPVMKMLVVIELIGIADSSHSQLNSLYGEIIIKFKLDKNASNRSREN